jgi:hypothetical protein
MHLSLVFTSTDAMDTPAWRREGEEIAARDRSPHRRLQADPRELAQIPEVRAFFHALC